LGKLFIGIHRYQIKQLLREKNVPDFDLFERYLKSTIEGELSIVVGANLIQKLSEENKVQVVKGRSQKELEDFLQRAYVSIRKFFPDGAVFTSNDNNRQGKDLLETNSGVNVELKSGTSMTDGNPGLESVAWALDTPDVSRVMKEGMETRRKLLLSGSSGSAIQASKDKSMDELFIALSKTRIGLAQPKLTHYFKSMAVGITKLDEIKQAYSTSGPTSSPLLLKADWRSGLVLYDKAFLPNETIQVTTVERTRDRAQLTAKGSITGRTAVLYPNFKNSWTTPDGRKFSADNWVATACFHVWID
jgi:hypothetical protein